MTVSDEWTSADRSDSTCSDFARTLLKPGSPVPVPPMPLSPPPITCSRDVADTPVPESVQVTDGDGGDISSSTKESEDECTATDGHLGHLECVVSQDDLLTTEGPPSLSPSKSIAIDIEEDKPVDSETVPETDTQSNDAQLAPQKPSSSRGSNYAAIKRGKPRVPRITEANYYRLPLAQKVPANQRPRSVAGHAYTDYQSLLYNQRKSQRQNGCLQPRAHHHHGHHKHGRHFGSQNAMCVSCFSDYSLSRDIKSCAPASAKPYFVPMNNPWMDSRAAILKTPPKVDAKKTEKKKEKMALLGILIVNIIFFIVFCLIGMILYDTLKFP
ncbi:hypothetical protein HDE_00647 [Halotydeus destructor]|nr:hypothetical protein HDE_00647 [Halotydeus destructor]